MMIPRTDLPADAIAALDAGTTWEYEPEGIATDGMEIPRQSSTGWYRTWHFKGIRVAAGVAYYTSWSLDECSDFQCDGEFEEDTSVQDLAEFYAAWADYKQFVIETGTDPLGNYYVKREYKRNEIWQFKAQQSIPGMVLHYVRRNGRGPKLTGDEIPAHVRQFLALRNIRPGLDCVGDFTSVEDIQERASEVSWQRAGALQVLGWHTLETRTKRAPGAIARDLRLLARR